MEYGTWFMWPRPIGRESVTFVEGDDGARYVAWQASGYNLWEWYRPMEDRPALYRDFVSLVVDGDDVDAAFRMLGPLDATWQKSVGLQGTFDEYREPVAYWLHNREVMAGVLDLHDALVKVPREPGAVAEIMDTPREHALLIPHGESVPGSLAFGVQNAVGDEGLPLFEHAEEAITRVVNYQMQDRVAFTMRRDAGKLGALSLDVQPTSLLGAMWLMLSRELMGNVATEPCKHCGKWFSMNASSVKRGKRFCSDKCRVDAHRKKNPVKGGETK